MKKISNYITIGELSKYTGVGIKSLRYYEEIGVLKPAWINPENSYRYYTFPQVSLVTSIQFYVSLGIPLEKIKDFVDVNGAVNYEEQISYGIDCSVEKINQLTAQLAEASAFLKDIQRCESLRTGEKECEMKPMECLAVPMKSFPSEEQYYIELRKLISEVYRTASVSSCKTGAVISKDGIFIFATADGVREDHKRFLRIPGGMYHCSIAAFEEPQKLIGENKELIVITELFGASFDEKRPEYELRWK